MCQPKDDYDVLERLLAIDQGKAWLQSNVCEPQFMKWVIKLEDSLIENSVPFRTRQRLIGIPRNVIGAWRKKNNARLHRKAIVQFAVATGTPIEELAIVSPGTRREVAAKLAELKWQPDPSNRAKFLELCPAELCLSSEALIVQPMLDLRYVICLRSIDCWKDLTENECESVAARAEHHASAMERSISTLDVTEFVEQHASLHLAFIVNDENKLLAGPLYRRTIALHFLKSGNDRAFLRAIVESHRTLIKWFRNLKTDADYEAFRRHVQEMHHRRGQILTSA